MEDLLKLRDEIDKIDNQIVELYEQRMQIAECVARYKIATGKKVFDKQREVSKLETLGAKAGSEFTRIGIVELFEQIMAMSRKRQYQLLNEAGVVETPAFEFVEDFAGNQVKVVFQGVEGAYSQLAMTEYFGNRCDSFHVDTWKDAMEAIKSGRADFAVLPIENSSAGIVSENYDLLVEYDNYIVGEQILQIRHALVGLQEANTKDITTVYSHPQALMQCTEYLHGHGDWEKISMKNTAMAAKKIKDDADISHAAIASRLTAQIYGLKILEENIADSLNNSTRFIIVTNRKICSGKANRISICFEIAHESGSLYHILHKFALNNLNLCKLESRPYPEKKFEYMFYLDIEGKSTDYQVRWLLNDLNNQLEYFKFLGNYDEMVAE